MSRLLRAERKEDHIRVQACTFGSKEVYEFYSLNISYSGLLLASKDSFPFQVKTILELRIDPEKERLSETIECLATIGRIAKSKTTGTNKYVDFFGENPDFQCFLGVYFSDFSDFHKRIWFEYVDNVAHSFS